MNYPVLITAPGDAAVEVDAGQVANSIAYIRVGHWAHHLNVIETRLLRDALNGLLGEEEGKK